jgi:hypothetical protein
MTCLNWLYDQSNSNPDVTRVPAPSLHHPFYVLSLDGFEELSQQANTTNNTNTNTNTNNTLSITPTSDPTNNNNNSSNNNNAIPMSITLNDEELSTEQYHLLKAAAQVGYVPAQTQLARYLRQGHLPLAGVVCL